MVSKVDMARGPAGALQTATDLGGLLATPGESTNSRMEPVTTGPDPKSSRARRRRAVRAGLAPDIDAATALCDDPEPSVRSAALGALARLGALSDSRLVRAFADSDPTVRRRAATIAGRLAQGDKAAPRSAAVLGPLTEMLSDPEPLVAESAACALGEWGPEADGPAVEALAGMSRGNTDSRCRESAVAALGAIGAARSITAILDALDDRPAVRRRAVIALSAFDDPRADEGLRKCLEDRDWQVRQAAEDLLEDPDRYDSD